MLEIERKYAPATVCQWDELLRIAGAGAGDIRKVDMNTVYYDTPDLALRRARLMLRLRSENGQVVCCLKCPSAQRDARLELECNAQTIDDGVRALLAHADLPETARELLALPLAPMCSAAFVRHETHCTLHDVGFTLCFDRGSVSAAQKSEDICEIEIDYKIRRAHV